MASQSNWDGFFEAEEEMLAFAVHISLLSYACWLFFPNPRSPSLFEQRCNWLHYCDKHHKKGTLKRRIRMSKASFYKLLGYIQSYLVVNEVMANMRGGPIIPELCLYCTLRWLAGGSYLDICDITGISQSSFYGLLFGKQRKQSSNVRS